MGTNLGHSVHNYDVVDSSSALHCGRVRGGVFCGFLLWDSRQAIGVIGQDNEFAIQSVWDREKQVLVVGESWDGFVWYRAWLILYC